MEQDRGSGIIRRVIRSTASWAGMVAAANLAVTGTAHADIPSEMNSFFSDAGGAANLTGPSAFQGQSAGHYYVGNVWTHVPAKSVHHYNLQLPRARAGRGGIDLFSGTFSFITASEMIPIMKAAANNASGFTFQLP